MKRLLSYALCALLAVMLAAGGVSCTGSAPPEEAQTIRFGLLPAESAIPIIIAQEKGFFEGNQVRAELTTFPSPNDRNVAVQGGQLDGMIADTMTALTLFEGGFRMKITSDINEDFKLLTAPASGIETFAALDGKKVSLVPNFVLEYIMDVMAEENNITYETVVIPSIPARFEALLTKQIDAVIFTEPQATLLAAQGAYVLAGSKEYGVKAGTLLFDEDFLKEKPEAVQRFYQAYNEAVEYINNTDPAEYGDILSDYTFPDAIVTYLDQSGKSYAKAAPLTQDTFTKVLAWSKKKELVKQDYRLEDVSDFSFIE